MVDAKKTSNMIYRYLGNSGLRVSVISWGNWINVRDDQNTRDTVKVALDNGINFFDTAEIYGFGQGETSLGIALKELNVPRESLVISTKIFKCGSGVNDCFLSRKHINEGLRNSLKRLQLDYVDVVFAHRFDSITPLEEVCRSFDNIINRGLAFYWGTSEWEASQIMEAYQICEKYNLIKPIVEQPQYNMFVREKMEREYNHLFKKIRLGTTIWSPLFGGVLTGKYIDEIPKGSRFDVALDNAKFHFDSYQSKKAEYDEKLKNLREIATELGMSLAQLAITWAIKNPDVSTCIVGASRASQMEENVKCVGFMSLLTPEIEVRIEKILQNAPAGEFNWRDFTPTDNRRKQLVSQI
jgi:voltage-dependent potassium channel beta subunit